MSLQQQKVGEAIRDAEVTLTLLIPNPNRHPNPNPNRHPNPNPNRHPNPNPNPNTNTNPNPNPNPKPNPYPNPNPNPHPNPNPNQVTLRLLERAVNRAAPTAPASRAISRPGSV